MSEFRYKAFISYSHQDERWARWLQRALESYRVPRRVAGQAGGHGVVPERLRPVFRDREDLSSASDLTVSIRDELASSETLIVVCSPSSASSRWVNEEIRAFRKQGREDRILALVVDGDPLASGGPEACFPPALLESAEGEHREPLAADVRRYGDGKRLALLKIVAGTIGVRLDELRRRDAHRRMQRRIFQGAMAVLVVAVIGWFSWSAEKSREVVNAQRASSEELLGFMLGELDQLDPILGLEIVAPDDELQQQRVEKLNLDALDDESLLQSALEWREQGIEQLFSGEPEVAMEQFVRSQAALIELNGRQDQSTVAMFELSQTEYYVGEAHMRMGRIELAHRHWMNYGSLIRRLLNSDPRNPVYVIELSYTLMNLGALEQMQQSPDIDASLELLQAAVKYNQMALVLDPGNPAYRESLLTELSWLADAWMEKCALGNAFVVRQQIVTLRREMLSETPDDPLQLRESAYALNGLGEVQRSMGLTDPAVVSFEEAVGLLVRLFDIQPDNLDTEWQLMYRSVRLARLYGSRGELDRAAEIVLPMAQRVEELEQTSIASDQFFAAEAAFYWLDRAKLLIALGEVEEGEKELRSTQEKFLAQVLAAPEFRTSLDGFGWSVYESWHQFGKSAMPEVEQHLQKFLSPDSGLRHCNDAGLAARLAMSVGDEDTARALTGYVLSRGYYERSFVNFCAAYQLCPAAMESAPL